MYIHMYIHMYVFTYILFNKVLMRRSYMYVYISIFGQNSKNSKYLKKKYVCMPVCVRFLRK